MPGEGATFTVEVPLRCKPARYLHLRVSLTLSASISTESHTSSSKRANVAVTERRSVMAKQFFLLATACIRHFSNRKVRPTSPSARARRRRGRHRCSRLIWRRRRWTGTSTYMFDAADRRASSRLCRRRPPQHVRKSRRERCVPSSERRRASSGRLSHAAFVAQLQPAPRSCASVERTEPRITIRVRCRRSGTQFGVELEQRRSRARHQAPGARCPLPGRRQFQEAFVPPSSMASRSATMRHRGDWSNEPINAPAHISSSSRGRLIQLSAVADREKRPPT